MPFVPLHILKQSRPELLRRLNQVTANHKLHTSLVPAQLSPACTVAALSERCHGGGS